jgi:hypothetical protein
MNESDFASLRLEMLKTIAAHTTYASAAIGRDALNQRVMEVIGRVPRHDFVPVELRP